MPPTEEEKDAPPERAESESDEAAELINTSIIYKSRIEATIRYHMLEGSADLDPSQVS